jgi:predicted dienelactone hydrolase
MKIFQVLFVVIMSFFLFACTTQSDQSSDVGLQTKTITVPERDNLITVDFWYPAGNGGSFQLVGKTKIFQGVPAMLNARISEGNFPLIVISHGGLRASPHQSRWVAAGLVSRGFVVAVPQPPQLTDKDAKIAVNEIWLRPNDLSTTLTAIEEDSELNLHMDLNKIGAVGFFMGATSALSLAGAQIDIESYKQSCSRTGIAIDCAWFAKNDVDLEQIDINSLGRSYKDERVKAVLAVDPELSQVFGQTSLAEITVPVDIINLGNPSQIRSEFDASELATQIPTANYQTVSDSTPFSAFSLCTSIGSEILKEEGEDENICQDLGSRSRSEIHVQLLDMIEVFLSNNLEATEQ